jgi:hypothetical protein
LQAKPESDEASGAAAVRIEANRVAVYYLKILEIESVEEGIHQIEAITKRRDLMLREAAHNV